VIRKLGFGITDVEIPQSPGILNLAIMIKRYGNPWAGGLFDQPHITIKEIEVVNSVLNEIDLVKSQPKQSGNEYT